MNVLQVPQYQMLMTAFQEGLLSHAYLFHGPDTDSQMQVAFAFAHFLSCTDKKNTEVCGVCPACRAAAGGDILNGKIVGVDPEEKTIKVGVIHDIQYFLNLKQTEGAYKIVIMDKSETMQPESREIILKTLEEPAPGSVIFLLTSDRTQLTKTILSRCQSLYFPNRVILTGHDKERDFWLIAMRGDIAKTEAVMSLAQKKREAKKQQTLNTIDSIFSGDQYKAMVLAKEMADSDDRREALRQVVGVIAFHWIHKDSVAAGADGNPILLFSEKNKYDIIPQVLEKIMSLEQRLAATMLNPRLLLEDCFLQVAEIVAGTHK